MRLVILGGGGFRVPLVHRALAARPELGVDQLVLHDVDPGRLRVIAAVLPPVPGLRVLTTTDLPAALTGADFVFSAVRVGGAAGRVRDERRALELGVLGQETVGAGGLAYGLRTLPVVRAAALLQAELAPRAWLINFTNPAGLITQGLLPVLGDRVIGICDSPIGLIRRSCRALGVPETAVTADYLGINHLGWLRRLTMADTDLLPGLLADPARLGSFEEGRLLGDVAGSLGALPNEYLYFFYRARELTAQLAGGSTRGEVVRDEQEEFYRAAANPDSDPAALWRRSRERREESYLAEARGAQERDRQDLSGGGYEHVALDLIQALSGGPPAELIVNARNGSAYPHLPAELVLETRCLVDSDGARVVPGAMPDLHQLGLIASVRAAEAAVVAAVEEGSRAQAERAFAIHPLVGSWELASRLVDSLLADHPALAGILRVSD